MTQFSPRSLLLKTEVRGFYLRLPFQLATHNGFDATHIPKGNLVLCKISNRALVPYMLKNWFLICLGAKRRLFELESASYQTPIRKPQAGGTGRFRLSSEGVSQMTKRARAPSVPQATERPSNT